MENKVKHAGTFYESSKKAPKQVETISCYPFPTENRDGIKLVDVEPKEEPRE